MQTIQLEVRDDYTDKILDFLKLLPENVAKIKVTSQSSDKEDDELISRIEDIKNNKVKTISRDELFDNL